MALVKTSKLASGQKPPVSLAPPKTLRSTGATTRTATSGSRHDTVAERIAAATEELASGLTESAAATRQLAKSMEQIASGAEEAAGASQEQATAIKLIVQALTTARSEADVSSRRTDAVALSLSESSAQISKSVRAIERGAQRQTESVDLVGQLDRSANDIGEMTRAVSRISDQTNLLALNAAIEAARAGDHGRGFAVVADEVRTLAESSDKSAKEVQKIAAAIQHDVIEVGTSLRSAAEAALKDAQSAANLAKDLETYRDDMTRIAEGSREILLAALEAERASAEAQKGAEQIATAAEEQSSGVAEAQVAVEQQAKSLEQGQTAAQALASLAEEIRSGKTRSSSLDQIGANAEELSASIQEMSTTANEVMAAVDQINKASQLQSAATQQTSAALTQIEKSARLAQQNGKIANDRVQTLDAALKVGRTSMASLVNGVSMAVQSSQSSVAKIKRLEVLGRRIEKIVDAIALIAAQTSMLAVSGAVEAARAGESGRGFAVVSKDIRSLARDAAENVERAKDTVRGILDQISMLRTELEQILSATELEIHNGQAVSASLLKIGQDVLSLGASSKSILDGADSILASTSEMTKAARQIAVAAEEASAASREAATAATEQSRGVEDLAAAIEEIASLADELKRKPG